MNIKKLYEIYEENIDSIEEIESVEKSIAMLIDRVSEVDKELAMEIDAAIGLLTWNYEMQGFCGGFKVVKEMTNLIW